MKTRTLGISALFGVALVGTTVYAVTPAGGFGRVSSTGASAGTTDEPAAEGPSSRAAGPSEEDRRTAIPKNLSQFSQGSTVNVDARLGHTSLPAATNGETFVLVEARGTSTSGAGTPKVHLSIVIDKSGSMSGTRLPNALAAAERAVSRLHDGDTVSVIAFDTKTETMLPQTVVDGSSRSRAVEAIRKIHLGGDTCISCGLEQGLSELGASSSATTADVKQILLLSDGDATAGVRDLAGFRSISERAMGRGVSITTIGVALEFNESIMTTIAQASNGRHYFVEKDADLARVFEAEANALASTVASDTTAEIRLAPGVELVQVFDRAFQRDGSTIRVSLGALERGETKTVLVKVRMPVQAAGESEVAEVRVGFRDAARGAIGSESGRLSLVRSEGGSASDLDGVVVDRMQRSETVAALAEANSLFSVGKADAAEKRLAEAKQKLSRNRSEASRNAPTSRTDSVNKSFDMQEKELDRAQTGFAKPPPPKAGMPAPAPAPDAQRAQKATAKKNMEVALPMMK